MIFIRAQDLDYILERDNVANCRQCGKELPSSWLTDICPECSKANVVKIFRENPEVKQAFRESIEEMRKPENVKKMADDAVRFMRIMQSIQQKK